MNQKTLNIIYGLVIVVLIGTVVYFAVGKKSEPIAQQLSPTQVTNTPKSNPTPTPTPADPTANWKIYSSTKLGINFKYPANYIIMDRLNSEEKAILLGDKEFPKPEIAPWYHAPISILEYNESQLNDQVSSLSSVKKSTMIIDGQNANIVEGNFPDYPAPGVPADNHMKIVTIPSKNLTILTQDSYAGTKSDWKGISSVLTNILTILKFK